MKVWWYNTNNVSYNITYSLIVTSVSKKKNVKEFILIIVLLGYSNINPTHIFIHLFIMLRVNPLT